MTRSPHSRCGWMIFETLVAMTSLAVVLVGASAMHGAIAHANRYHLAKQRCILAAEGQLDHLALTGTAIDDARVADLWPGVTVTVEREDGKGQWEGMTLLHATATAAPDGRPIRVRLSRYVPRAGGES